MSESIVRMMQNRPGGGSSLLPPEQLTVERCIDIHDTDQATHVFLWDRLGTYLLRNVTILNTGVIQADYGLVRDNGTFMGWMSETAWPEDIDPGPQPGMFLPALGKLLTYREWQRMERDRRAFEKQVKFVERYGLSGTALRKRLSPLFPSTKEES